MATDHIRDLLSRRAEPGEYEAIRAVWKTHSIAEDSRDLAGLISTLTEDCVYEVFPGGHSWRGHEGARAFYMTLLGAFPDIKFDLQNIVIGPQGVAEEAHVTGTHRGRWMDMEPTGEAVQFTVVIFFPWDPERKKFRGERVFFQR